MPVETPSLFAQVIRDHLELKERNSDLDRQMPIERYKSEDPFDNHPLFKTEEQARLEETMDGVEPDFVAHDAPTSTPALARRGDRGERRRRRPQPRSRTPASGPSIAPATSTGATRPAGLGPRCGARHRSCLGSALQSTLATSRQVVDESRQLALPRLRVAAGGGSRSGGSSRSRARRAPSRASGRAPS